MGLQVEVSKLAYDFVDTCLAKTQSALDTDFKSKQYLALAGEFHCFFLNLAAQFLYPRFGVEVTKSAIEQASLQIFLELSEGYKSHNLHYATTPEEGFLKFMGRMNQHRSAYEDKPLIRSSDDHGGPRGTMSWICGQFIAETLDLPNDEVVIMAAKSSISFILGEFVEELRLVMDRLS